MDIQYHCETCLMLVGNESEKVCSSCQSLTNETEKVSSRPICKLCGMQNELSAKVCSVCSCDLHEKSKKLGKAWDLETNGDQSDEQKNCFLSSIGIIEIGSDAPVKPTKVAVKRKKKAPPPKPLPRVRNQAEIDPPFEPEELPFSPQSILEESEAKRMSELQKKAVFYMHCKSWNLHNKTMEILEEKVAKLGYNKEDLQNLNSYIQHKAPIIIHIHIMRYMEFFIKDTHYRSQFETNKSSGTLSQSSRTQWENRMFDKRYSGASDFERVKYGVMNFTNDQKGVSCALGYGRSYLLLKQHLRSRCTVSDKDSCSSDSKIGTLKYPFQVVNKFNTNELKSAFEAVKGENKSSTVTCTYKEVQIHGPLEFGKDIEKLYVCEQQLIDQNKKYIDMVKEFSSLFGVEYQFI